MGLLPGFLVVVIGCIFFFNFPMVTKRNFYVWSEAATRGAVRPGSRATGYNRVLHPSRDGRVHRLHHLHALGQGLCWTF